MVVVDAHLDLAFNALRYDRDLLLPLSELREFEERTGSPNRKLNGTALATIPALREAGVRIVFSSLFVPPISKADTAAGTRFVYSTMEQAHGLAMEQMDYYHRLADDHDFIHLVTDLSALSEVLDKSDDDNPLLGIVIMMEGADPIREPRETEMWYERGLRMVAPAWDDTGYSAGAWRGRGGLTRDGRELLEIMSEMSFILDLSHMSEQASLEALDSYDGQLAASHSNVRQLVPGQRQLSDQQIQRIAERDGVIGVVFFNQFIKAGHIKGGRKDAVTIDHLIAHVDHICQRVGDSLHVGLGTDFDGGFGLEDVPAEIETVADLTKVSDQLGERGYDVTDIENIMAGNWLRMLNNSLPG